MILVFVVSFYLSLATVFSSNIELSPIKDARVEEASPDSNFGNSVNLYVKSDVSADTVGDNKRTFLEFDLSSIPSDVTINSAILSLFAESAPGVSRTYNIQKVLSQWDESTINWNNQPDVNDTITSSNSTGTTDDVFHFFDVTEDVKSFYSSLLTNNGWRIADSSENSETGRETQYRSREFENETEIPKLIINFASCGISLDTNQIIFGSVSPDSESSEQLLDITNTGTDYADIFVSGTDWIGNNVNLSVSRTAYADFIGDFSSKTLLSSTLGLALDNLTPNNPTNIFWQFKPEVNDPAGTYSQTITITASC